MLPQEFIRTKRDGGSLRPEDIKAFVNGMVSGAVTEGQAAAFAMAVFFNGMMKSEAIALTEAMRDSGTVLDWSRADLGGPALDKHSTGGVGDNVSLLLAPAVAACGGYVPMISGRGLGHTGGTLDKLDSIPGYTTQPDNVLFRKVVKQIGCAIIGQTDDLAPADKCLYGIRDVTATVESIPLITASILSKKLAAGLHGLAMDVKTGSGAFMPTLDLSSRLARTLCDVAKGAGLPTAALITDMNEALAPAAGNAVEVRNALDNLSGRRKDTRLLDITIALGGEMLRVGGLATDAKDGWCKIARALEDGRAAEKFGEMSAALGGPRDIVENTDRYLPSAPIVRPVFAATPGKVASVDTRALGLAVVSLGGGRTRAADPVDHAVGLTELAPIGSDVDESQALALVHARTDDAWEIAAATVRAAYTTGEPQSPNALVVERIV